MCSLGLSRLGVILTDKGRIWQRDGEVTALAAERDLVEEPHRRHQPLLHAWIWSRSLPVALPPECSAGLGIGVRLRSERVFGFARNLQYTCTILGLEGARVVAKLLFFFHLIIEGAA